MQGRLSQLEERMITLFVGGAGFGLPEVSPYVTKTEVQLKMAGVPYRKEEARPYEGPKGQLPFIDDDGTRIGDSTFILAHLEKKYGANLNEWLAPRERAEAWAIERMVENHFNPAWVHGRWMIPENFDKGPAHFFDTAPPDMRDKIRGETRERVGAALLAQGPARHKPEEIVWLGEKTLSALSTLLGDKPYIMGDKPCAEDATVFAALAGVLTPFFDMDLQRKAATYPNLVAYTARLMKQYYPEHPWRA
jgi:glutathione S-transferase